MTTFDTQFETPMMDSDPYRLNEQQFGELENSLVTRLNEASDNQTVHAVWIPQDNEHASLVRTLEMDKFPEIADVMEPFEEQSVFLAMVDNRPEAERIVHAFRLTSLGLAGMEMPEDSTGVALIDDIIDSGQDLTSEQFKAYYHDRGVDITKSVSVETNFRQGEKVDTDSGLPVSQLGYLAIFRALKTMGVEVGKGAVFAHLNKPAIVSLGGVGIDYEPIAGNADLKTPTKDTEGHVAFDEKYKPVAILATEGNMQVFEDLMPFSAPEVNL